MEILQNFLKILRKPQINFPPQFQQTNNLADGNHTNFYFVWKKFNNRAVPTFGNVIVLAVLLISMDKTMFAIRWFLWWKDLPCDEKQDLGEGGTQCIGPFVIHNFAQKHTTCKIRLAFLFCISICICQLRIRSQTHHYTTCICISFSPVVPLLTYFYLFSTT